MFSKFFKLIMFGATLSLGLQCTKPSSILRGQQGGAVSRREASVTKGQGMLGAVKFPLPFVRTRPDGVKAAITSGEYEVRYLPGSSKGELLFAAREDEAVYSDNIYAIGLDGQFRVRSVTEQEWAQAERVPNGGQRVSTVEYDKSTASVSKKPEVQYRGKSFPRTGEA